MKSDKLLTRIYTLPVVVLLLAFALLIVPGLAQDDATTPEPTSPSLVVTASPASPAPGDSVSLSLDLFNVVDLFGLQVRCQVNPAVLAGLSAAGAAGFNESNSYLVDQGFNAADGTWLVAATRLQPNPAISGNVTAFTLTYNVISAGDSQLTCEAVAVDSLGSTLPLTVLVNGPALLPPTSTPTIEPTVTLTPETTPEPTPETTPEPTPVPASGIISGTVQYQNRTENAGITAQLFGADGTPLAETQTAADGAYRFADVAPGEYVLVLAAPQHIPVVYDVVLSDDETSITLDTAILPAGDADNSGTVDIVDAALVGANLGVSVPPAPMNADLNLDLQVNISDLVLVGSNFGLVSPLE